MLNDLLQEFHGIFIGLLYDYESESPITRIALKNDWIKINSMDFTYDFVEKLDNNLNLYDIIINNPEKTVDDVIVLLRNLIENNRQIEKMQEEHFKKLEEFKLKIIGINQEVPEEKIISYQEPDPISTYVEPKHEVKQPSPSTIKNSNKPSVIDINDIKNHYNDDEIIEREYIEEEINDNFDITDYEKIPYQG